MAPLPNLGNKVIAGAGSIGKTTLNLIKKEKTNFEVVLLTSHRNIKELDKQTRMFKVKNLIVTDDKSYAFLKRKFLIIIIILIIF